MEDDEQQPTSIGQSVMRDLSPRQRQALAGIAAGRGRRQIADDLGISEHTLKQHVRTALAYLNARTVAQAVAVAVRNGLL